MSWFVNTDEVQRQGAKLILHRLLAFEAVQTALQQIDQGVPLEQIASKLGGQLENAFTQQETQIKKLQEDLAWQKSMRASLEERSEGWIRDPLQKQITVAAVELKQKSEQVIELTGLLDSTQSILDQERNQHKLEVAQLGTQIQELNRLVAKQHNQLEQLTGANTPE